MTNDDEAPIPFDSDDAPVDVRIPPTPTVEKESPKAPAYFAPPKPPTPQAPRPSEEPQTAPSIDKDSFYDGGAPGVGANRPQAKEPAKTVVYIDHRHRVSNDDGLILVVCGICGTRAHFAASKGETEQQCPDCFTKFRLPKLPPGPEKETTAPPKEELDEFKLEETFERHGYQPFTRDSATADQIKGPPPSPTGGAPTGAPPSLGPVPGVPIPPGPTSTNAASFGNVVAPPLPPAFGGAMNAPVSAEPIPPEAVAALSAAGAAPSMINPENRLPRPPNWAVLVDVFNFPFRPLHLLALISFTILVMIPIAAAVFVMAKFPGRLSTVLTFGVIPPLEAAPFVFVASYFIHIVHDSSYGEKEVRHWNAVNLVDNMVMAIYVFCAIFFAGFPGFLLSLPFSGSESNMQFLFILVSTVIFFPFCLLSLLEEESYWQVYNHEVAKSFRRSADQVFLFVCGQIVFTAAAAGLAFGVGSIVHAAAESSVTTMLIVLALMVLVGIYWLFCYGRMVGRLAWVMNYEAQYGPLEDDD